MKDERKNKILTQMIREALDKMLFLSEDDDEPEVDPQLSWLQGQGAQEIEDRQPGSYYDDSEMHLPWDDRLKELSSLLTGIALDVIDHYKGKPSFTKEAAKKEILEAVGVPLDVFLGDQHEFGEFYSLDQILEEEFRDVNESAEEEEDEGVDAIDLNIDGGSKADMGEISEGYDDEEEYESNVTAEAIAGLEKMHQNLEGIIDRLKEDPNAPLGTDIAMAYSGLDEALSRLRRRKKHNKPRE